MDLLTLSYDHMIWATDRAVRALEAMPADAPERSRAAGILAHMAGAAHVWRSRLQELPPEHPPWPDLSVDEAAALATRELEALRPMTTRGPEGLAAEVVYRNSAGQEYRNTTADILTHVTLHGSYHLGQLALLTRAGGGTPAATDYIVYLRGVPTPPG